MGKKSYQTVDHDKRSSNNSLNRQMQRGENAENFADNTAIANE